MSLVGTVLERPKELKPAGNELLVQTYTDPKEGSLIDFAVPLEFSKVPLRSLYLVFSQEVRSSEPWPQRPTKLFLLPV